MKKTNPNRIPVTMADVKKKVKGAAERTIMNSFTLFFTVLLDKEGMTSKDIRRIYNEVEDLSRSIREGYVSWNDLYRTLKDEEDLSFENFYNNKWI